MALLLFRIGTLDGRTARKHVGWLTLICVTFDRVESNKISRLLGDRLRLVIEWLGPFVVKTGSRRGERPRVATVFERGMG